MTTSLISKFRRLHVLPVVAVLLFIATGCGNGGSPREVAENFLAYCGKNDFNRAKDYCTEEGDRVMGMMNDLYKMMPDSAQAEVKYEVLSEKIEGEVATVQYRRSGTTEDPASLTLVKEEGKWLVSMTKESVNTPLFSDQPSQ